MRLYFMSLKVVTILFYPATISGNLYGKIVLPVNVGKRELKKGLFLCEASSSTAFCRQVRQLCNTSTGKARCICAEGWKGSRCQNRIDEPQLDLPTKMPTSSRAGSACTLSIDCAMDNSYCLEGQCQCQPGFTPRKGNCINVNECGEHALNGCHRDALCIDTNGNYECNCKLGFSDTNPTLPGRQCQQTNECEIGAHNCDEATQLCLDRRPPEKWECVEQTPAPTIKPTHPMTPPPTPPPISTPASILTTALPTFILAITSKEAEATNNPTSQFTSSAPINIQTPVATTLTPTDPPTTASPTLISTITPITAFPTSIPTTAPTTALQTANPSCTPTTTKPTSIPTNQPTSTAPTKFPTANPITVAPTFSPTDIPTTASPTLVPTIAPTTALPTDNPTILPTTAAPTNFPTINPTTIAPTFSPTDTPTTVLPTLLPTKTPTTAVPTENPTTVAPTRNPTPNPTNVAPTKIPTPYSTTPAPTSIPTANPTAALPEITGAFEVSLIGRFDNYAGFSWQRFFDFGNGPSNNNVLLGQWSNTNDMFLEIWKNGSPTRLFAYKAIINGETATWQTGVETNGKMWIRKNGQILAEKTGIIPVNVTRINKFIGKSNWANDAPLRGVVENFQLVNK